MSDVDAIRAYYRETLPYYDAALADRGDLPFWEALAKRWSSKQVLELGCGTGRVTEVLSRHASVTAVDLLIELLPHGSHRARFVAADIRRFAFLKAFDLIVLASDPMAHMTSTADRRQAMRLIADHLAPGGRVVVEGLFNPSDSVRRVGTLEIEERWERGRQQSIWTVAYRYTLGSSMKEVTSTVRSWTRDEVLALRDSGLEAESIWGDFDERPLSDQSKRIVFLAKPRNLP